MTEGDWRTGTSAPPMLLYLGARLTGRRLRLFACACCRAAWHLLADRRSRAAVEAAERFADGEIDKGSLSLVYAAAATAAEESAQGLHAEFRDWAESWLGLFAAAGRRQVPPGRFPASYTHHVAAVAAAWAAHPPANFRWHAASAGTLPNGLTAEHVR